MFVAVAGWGPSGDDVFVLGGVSTPRRAAINGGELTRSRESDNRHGGDAEK
jgi:hypothetical protein